jgi:hypothetical protein
MDLATKTPTMKPPTFLKSSTRDFVLNLNNDYRYLKTGYYVSMHAEVLGNPVIPSSGNIIDANRTPILLLKASKAGIPVLPHLVTDSVKQVMSKFGFPVVVFAVNPFSFDGFRVAQNRSSLYRAMKSLGMNYKFAVCVQPLRGEMVSFKSVFGKCESDGRLDGLARRVFEVFQIPLCKLHAQLVGDNVYLCGLQPLRKDEILPTDLQLVSEEIVRISNMGEHLVG